MICESGASRRATAAKATRSRRRSDSADSAPKCFSMNSTASIRVSPSRTTPAPAPRTGDAPPIQRRAIASAMSRAVAPSSFARRKTAGSTRIVPPMSKPAARLTATSRRGASCAPPSVEEK
ncbi:MAG: hypothetical protein LC785_16040 [Acidobacteria bacterium]|nr:hypothetical protein [Acidobacteriota bacterium]